MKRVLLIALFVAAAASAALAQYPEVSIHELQQVPAESLAVADGIAGFAANSTQTRWTLQTSPYMGDTEPCELRADSSPNIETGSS